MQYTIRSLDPVRTICRVIMVLTISVLFTSNLVAQPDIKPDDRENFAVEANKEFNNGNWDAGKKRLDAGLKKYPKDSDLKMLLGKYYFHYKQNDRARYELKKALEQNPDNVDAKQILVNVETESKRYSSAICYVNELLEVNPYWKVLWRKKIELYKLQGNTVEANRLLKRINQIYPADTILRRDYVYETEMEAITMQKAGRIDEAIELRTELIKSDPTNPNHYMALANDYIKAGDTYNALASLDRGLTYTPGNIDLISKKTSLLADQKRYTELLSFLQLSMRSNNSAALRQQYNYFLLEAARNAKDSDPATLYGKILEGDPGNEEAFNYVFNSLYGSQQYEEALYVLDRYRRARGNNKIVMLKELNLHKKLENTGQIATLTRELFLLYPNDTDLRDAYVKIVYDNAKNDIANERYAEAITGFKEVMQYGEGEIVADAQNSLYNSAMALNNYNMALDVLNDKIFDAPDQYDLYIKRAEIYHKQKRYHNALTAYEQALSLTSGEEKLSYLGGYGEMVTEIVKDLNEDFRYQEAYDYVKRWLVQDGNNNAALRYAINLANQTNKKEEMLAFAQKGNSVYPDDIFFKIKLAEFESVNPENYAEIHEELRKELLLAPYHEGLINTFSQLSEDYAGHLIEEKKSTQSIEVLDTALRYAPNNNSLKYLKGVAYEKLHQFDSAYQYQSYYDVSSLELSEFKQHLNYLYYKNHKNEIGIYHLRARHGDDFAISTISTVEYSRLEGINTYIGRVNYAGRETGKGYQIQGEWGRVWNEKTHTRLDLAWANKFFPKIAFNGSVFRQFDVLDGIEAEGGLGYRWLSTGEHMNNLVVGATKELELWRLNIRLNNYMLNYEYEIMDMFGNVSATENRTEWLFNLSAQARYYMSSPKNYLMGMTSVGTAPDVDLINYQLYEGFSGVNTMVGAGIGHMLSKTVSAGILGTWYNYHLNTANLRNLYTVYLNLNVVF